MDPELITAMDKNIEGFVYYPLSFINFANEALENKDVLFKKICENDIFHIFNRYTFISIIRNDSRRPSSSNIRGIKFTRGY